MLSAFHCWAHGGRPQLKKGPESCSLQEARKQVEQAATRKRAGRVGWGRLGCGSGGSEDYGVAPEGFRERGPVKGGGGSGGVRTSPRRRGRRVLEETGSRQWCLSHSNRGCGFREASELRNATQQMEKVISARDAGVSVSEVKSNHSERVCRGYKGRDKMVSQPGRVLTVVTEDMG
ncbi:hypothetical protein BT67DRAFT_443446 [Trichocladium antarcticum]|uniref:Uncharacterized protein n=1 Tax=Trichocladium antarcticum TaxID=1450529 RepID=A0AAN6UHD9_9PEZI|nr:hypothetical protein BT67DRAFT_443446 [Trichocladium antarcticum]